MLLAAAFLVSAPSGRPLAARLASDFLPMPGWFASQPVIRRYFIRITILWGGIQLANAGIGLWGDLRDVTPAEWRRVLDVNLMGVIHGVHAIYPRMVRRGRGHLVNIASVAGLAPYPLALPYTTTKHAVVGMSLALRAEARAHGVAVGVACPGAIETPIWQRSTVRGVLDRARTRFADRLPRRMSADKCAAAIVAGIAADRAVIPVTLEAHAAWWLARHAPWLANRLAQRVAGRVLAYAAPA